MDRLPLIIKEDKQQPFDGGENIKGSCSETQTETPSHARGCKSRISSWAVLALVVISVICGMSTWFSAAAILPQLEVNIPSANYYC